MTFIRFKLMGVRPPVCEVARDSYAVPVSFKSFENLVFLNEIKGKGCMPLRVRADAVCF